MKPGQIIVVSGTSGSGKSTTCELLAKRSEEFWLLYGIDHFLSATMPLKYGHHGPRSREGIYAEPVDASKPDGMLRWRLGPYGVRAFRTLHDWIAAASRAGCNIILDHLMMQDPPVLQDCVWRLKDLPVLFVSLKPPFEVLMQRVASRTMDKRNPAQELFGNEGVRIAVERLNRLRPWFYESVYANDCYDLEIDTVQHTPDEVCTLIEQRLAAGPGTAFDTLRKRHAEPQLDAHI
ncbi:MAG TPA: AAA family ATPase [Steroidobacteraceae bacterium]|jgi:chloramphenicol 3-O-phosphotransferase|nr:AAA family ATPase [Steroidobacteraceae bacterium]